LIGNLVPHPNFDRQLLSELDVLVVNEHEAADILGVDDADPSGAVRELQRLGPKAVVVTAGRGGAYFVFGDRFGHVAAEMVDVVDSSGAGDAFLGALATELSRHSDLVAAVAVANSVAAIAVQQHGSLLSTPRLEGHGPTTA
jgi:ribokinase